MDVGRFEGFTSPDGRRLTYWIDGRGPILVCHPGGPGAATGAEFLDFCGLADHLTLVKFNPKGVGGSDRPQDKNAYSLADYAGDLESLRQHLGTERLSIFGHSHGGKVAIAYALSFPDCVDRLVLSGTPVKHYKDQQQETLRFAMSHQHEPWFPPAWRAAQLVLADKWSTEEELGRLMIEAMPLAFGHFGDREVAALRAGHEAFLHPNGDAQRYVPPPSQTELTEALSQIHVPTLVFHGTADPLVSSRNAGEIGASIPGARVVMLEGVGHAFPWEEARERMRDELVAFFARA